MAIVDCIQLNIALIGRRKFVIAAIAISALLLSGPLLIRRLSVDERAFLFRGQMILLIEAVLFTGSWYVWSRLRYLLDSVSRDGSHSPVVYCIRFTKLAVAVMLVLAQMSFVIHYFVHGQDPPLLSFICFVCLGILVQFVVCYFCINRAYQLIDWVHVNFGYRQRIRSNISVQWMKFFISLLSAITMSVYGLYGGFKVPAVKTVEIPIKGLAMSMDRLSMAAVADIHLGPTVGRTKLEQVVHIVNTQEFGMCHLFMYCSPCLYNFWTYVCELSMFYSP